MQICTLLTIKLIDRLFQTARHMGFFYVLFYNFFKIKSFISIMYFSCQVYNSQYCKTFKGTCFNLLHPLLHHHHNRKIHHHEKENSTGHSTKQNRKITKYYWHKREQRTEYCQKPHFSPFLEYEMYNGFIQSPKIERFIGFWAPLSRFKHCSHSITQGRQSMFTETSC